MNISEFSKLVFTNQDNIIKKYETKQDNLMIEEKYLKRIAKYLNNLQDEKEQKTYFDDIISKPNMENGKLYEILVYAWLEKNASSFNKQVHISVDECLKQNAYIADGDFNNIVFDIKKFGISFSLYEKFREKLQELIPDYYITVGGLKNLDTKTIQKELIEKVLDWKEKLLSKKSSLYDDYQYKNSDYGIEIRAHNKKSPEKVYTTISECNFAQWAKENELYFFYHASQFCCNKPYMVICPFIDKDFPCFAKDYTDTYYAFRFLCRRMFMNVVKSKNILLRAACDGHAKDGVTLETASRKLSAVIFLDISEEWSYKDCRCWVYANPNADFPLSYFDLNSFKLSGACIDNFEYDNY